MVLKNAAYIKGALSSREKISIACVVFQRKKMDGLSHVGLPVLGILAVSVVTFYVVSFAEIREVRRYETNSTFPSFQDR